MEALGLEMTGDKTIFFDVSGDGNLELLCGLRSGVVSPLLHRRGKASGISKKSCLR